MKMATYFDIIKFNFFKTLDYPWEVFVFIARRLFELGMLILFWYAVQKSSEGLFNFKHLVAYFLAISAFSELIFINAFSFGDNVGKVIKSGEISNYLIKPISVVPNLFFTNIGERALTHIYSIIILLLSLVILSPDNILNIFGFIVLACLSFFISISLNILIGSLPFYFTDARSFKNVLVHINNILSGSMIPLFYFTGMTRKFILLTPFASATYSPIFVLQNKVSQIEFVKIFTVSLFWAISLSFFAIYIWKKALKKYEGVGM